MRNKQSTLPKVLAPLGRILWEVVAAGHVKKALTQTG